MFGISEEVSNLDVDSFRTSLDRSNAFEFPKTFEPERTIIIKDLEDKLSFPAKLVIIIVLMMPDGLLEMVKGRYIGSNESLGGVKKAVKCYFAEIMELEEFKIERIWEEIRMFMKKIDEI